MHVPKLYLTEPFSWKIRDIDIRPTYKCQAKCPTCGSWKRKTRDLTLEQAKQITTHFKGLRKVILEGGEPTVWPYLGYMIENLDAQDVVVITNAINTKVIKKLSGQFRPKNFRWVVSLNGMQKAHDFSRGYDGAFDALVKSVDIMAEFGYDIRFQFMGLKETIDDLPAVKDLIRERWNNDKIMVCYPSTANIYGENIQATYLTEQEMKQIILTEGKSKKWVNRFVEELYTEKVLKREIMPCLYGRSKIHINPLGTIEVCHYSNTPMPIGQVCSDKVVIYQKTRKWYCKHKECQYATGTLCDHEAVTLGIRHNFFYMLKELWKNLI